MLGPCFVTHNGKGLDHTGVIPFLIKDEYSRTSNATSFILIVFINSEL